VSCGEHGWWAPCVWCALGIATLVREDVEIHVRLGAEQRETRIVIAAGKLTSLDLPVPMSEGTF
jgi:tRNA pseudouridine-54 N-methylase